MSVTTSGWDATKATPIRRPSGTSWTKAAWCVLSTLHRRLPCTFRRHVLVPRPWHPVFGRRYAAIMDRRAILTDLSHELQPQGLRTNYAEVFLHVFCYNRPMDTLQKVLQTLEDTEREAELFIKALLPEAQKASLITLSGELGAGKTAFTQYVAKALGIADVVNSPTFVIEKIYGISENKHFKRLIHIDAYRLQDVGDLNSLGFGEIMSHQNNLVILEWPEHVVGISEQASIRILLEALPDGSRQITYA